MTPLDAARALVTATLVYETAGRLFCSVCHAEAWPEHFTFDRDALLAGHPGEHEPGCPVFTLPRIVAALEAAERVAAISQTGWCTVIAPPVVRESIQALDAVLNGEA